MERFDDLSDEQLVELANAAQITCEFEVTAVGGQE